MNTLYRRFSNQQHTPGQIALALGYFGTCTGLLLFLFLLSSCQSSASNEDVLPEVDLWALMLPESAIPNGWKLLETSDEPVVSFGEERAANLIFYYLDDPTQLTRGGVTLFQHHTQQSATNHYEKRVEVFSDPDDPRNNTPLFVPEGFQFKSSGADKWYFSCVGLKESFVPASVS